MKGLLGVATIIGAGATGATLADEKVYAAETSVDVKSQVVGSVEQGSQSSDHSSMDLKNQETSQALVSKSSELSLSDSTTISSSQQTSESNSLSESTTTSASHQTSTSGSSSTSTTISNSQHTSLSTALSQSEVTLNSLELSHSLTKQDEVSSPFTSASLTDSYLSTVAPLTSATGTRISLNSQNTDKKQDFAPISNAMVAMLATNVSSDKTTTLPSFTGAAWFDANEKVFEAGSTVPAYKVRLSTAGNSTVQDPKFIIMIPGGFTANEADFNWPEYSGTYSIKDLGHYGPNKEQLFMVTLDGSNPAWNAPSMTIGLSLDATAAGQYTYNDWGVPLVSEVSTDGNPAAEASAGGGNYTFNINGQEIQVSKSTNTVNDAQWYNAASTISYSVQAGNQQINQNSYKIIDIVTTPYQVTNPNDVGYEQLSFTFNSTGEIKSGEYFDVKLGLPTSDGQLLTYDSTLAATFSISYNGSEIGTVYNMGTYYRVVFNSNVEQYTSGNNKFKLNFELRWGNDKNNIVNNAYMQPSVGIDQNSTDNLGKIFVYQYTSDKSLNKSKFAYTPTNDVQIGSQTYASGLHIQGQYIFDGKYQNGNTITTGSLGRSTNRTWTPSNQVSINTNWYNAPQVQIATNGATNKAQNTSNDFNITISVGKNDYLNYYWATDEELLKQFQDIIAPYVTNTLSNQVEAEATNEVLYVNSKVEEQDTPTTKITITHTEETLSDGRIQRVYHILIADPSIEFKEGSHVTPLTVSANNYTMPADIKSYQEDIDAAKSEGAFGTVPRNSAATSNTELAQALANTPIALISVTNNTTAQNIFSNLGSNWIAAIAYQTNGNVDGAVDPSNTRTATLRFIDITDPNTPILLPEATNTVQGEADSSISFSGATATMTGLASQGYEIVRVENNQTGASISVPAGMEKNDLSEYNFGNLINSANEYTVYISKASYLSTSQSTSQSIVESISTVGSQSTSQSIVDSISTVESQSISQSIINSVSDSIHTSVSLSASTSAQVSQSISNASSVSQSVSASASRSESLSNSVSMSESMSNSMSMSKSVSMSESISNSVSKSESLSNSVSMSESLSNSVSMSESLSNSVSMRESMSNSVSMSESLSNSVSMSESLSNSVSMSESMSNSVSMSESLSNSVSMSESMSNSVSMSESLSNSVSMSESIEQLGINERKLKQLSKHE